MYVIPVMPESVAFIGEHLNDGVIPKVEKNITFFVFGDDKPNEIITAKECYDRFGRPPRKASIQIFEVS